MVFSFLSHVSWWFNVTSDFRSPKRFRYFWHEIIVARRECQKHFEASPHSEFSRVAAFTGIHFARDTEIGRINHFAADEIASEDDRIKFPAARDAELSYGFVRELIMFRNRRSGDRGRIVYAWWRRTMRGNTRERREREREREKEKERIGDRGKLRGYE